MSDTPVNNNRGTVWIRDGTPYQWNGMDWVPTMLPASQQHDLLVDIAKKLERNNELLKNIADNLFALGETLKPKPKPKVYDMGDF